MTEITEDVLAQKIAAAKREAVTLNVREDRRSAYWVTEGAYKRLKHLAVDLDMALTTLVSNVLEGLTTLSDEDMMDLAGKLVEVGDKQRKRRRE